MIVVTALDPQRKLAGLAQDIADRANRQGKPVVGCYSALDREVPWSTSLQDRLAVKFEDQPDTGTANLQDGQEVV